jgi:hypothetical protein
MNDAGMSEEVDQVPACWTMVAFMELHTPPNRYTLPKLNSALQE